MTQQTFDDARTRRDVAIRRVAANSHEDWKRAAMDAVHTLARRRVTVHANDIHEYMARNHPGLQPHEPRAWGPVMLAAVKAGWLRKTDRVRQVTVTQSNAYPKPVYESLLWEPQR